MIKENTIHISYPTGEMNIVIDKFFPTTLDRVNQLSKIIRDHVPEDEQMELYKRLKAMASSYKEEAEKYEKAVDGSEEADASYEEAYSKMKECQKNEKQMERDIKAYLKITKLEV